LLDLFVELFKGPVDGILVLVEKTLIDLSQRDLFIEIQKRHLVIQNQLIELDIHLVIPPCNLILWGLILCSTFGSINLFGCVFLFVLGGRFLIDRTNQVVPFSGIRIVNQAGYVGMVI
jgi:hypothetical protein